MSYGNRTLLGTRESGDEASSRHVPTGKSQEFVLQQTAFFVLFYLSVCFCACMAVCLSVVSLP